jgi:hypothetical protein
LRSLTLINFTHEIMSLVAENNCELINTITRR